MKTSLLLPPKNSSTAWRLVWVGWLFLVFSGCSVGVHADLFVAEHFGLEEKAEPQGNDECPRPTEPYGGLTPDVMEMVLLAAEASSLVYNVKRSKRLHRRKELKYYRNEPDAVLTRMLPKQGYCVVAFRGTTKNALDWAQNVPYPKVELFGGGKSNKPCNAGIGITSAFLRQGFDVGRDVDECMRECVGCKLLVTGHSQGGAIANAAAMIFGVSYEPYVVTFGQPPTLSRHCGLYTNSDRWFRFIRAISHDDGLEYDIVPMLPGGWFFGHEIVVSSTDLSSVHYVGLDQHEDNLPAGADPHSMAGYLDDIRVLATQEQIETRGFNDYAQCTEDTECISNQCEEQITGVDLHTCVPRKNACEECDAHYECISGCCLGDFLFFSGQCADGSGSVDSCEPTSAPSPAPTPRPTPSNNGGGGGGGGGGGLGQPTNQQSGNDSKFSGDPHITTFGGKNGGKNYDCQGEGEFGMVQSPDASFAVQGRFTRFSSQQITVTTGVLIQDDGSATIQFSQALLSDPETLVLGGCPVHIFLDGALVPGPVGSVLDESFDSTLVGVSIAIASDIFRVTYDTGVDLVVSVSQSNYFGCWFHATVYIPFAFRPDELLIGILGSANDNAEDGWLSRDGTPIAFSSGISAGYNYCTANWLLSESDSLFAYESGKSYSDFANPAPYTDTLDLNDADQEVKDFCKGDEDCLLEGLLGGIDAARDLQQINAGLRIFRGGGDFLDSKSSFALAGATVIDFESFPPGTYWDPIDLNGVTFDPGASFLRISSGQRYNTDGWYLDNSGPGFKKLDIFFDTEVTAFGFNWGASNTIWTLTSYDLQNNTVTSYNLPVLTSSNRGEFYGISGVPMTRAVVEIANPLESDWILIDNFSFVLAAN